MVKELERAGIPTVQICTMVNVAIGMGANRIVPSRSVLYPTGDPELTLEEEKQLRYQLVKRAVEGLKKEFTVQTVLEAGI